MAPQKTTAGLAILFLAGAMSARGDIRVDVGGVEDDARGNVLAYLSVERYRGRGDVDEDTMRRLFNRVDGEVRNALRPFGYYEPEVTADYRASGRDWLVDIRVVPGEPVRIRELSIAIEGPGADDPVFGGIRNQTLLRVGSRLHHGNYEKVKSALTLAAARNGYLAARMVRPPEMRVDVAAHSAAIDLAFDTGPRYSFGRVEIEQNVIRPELMRRFLRFREGDPFSANDLLRTQFALDDSLYFRQVDVERGDADPETLTVPIRITATKSRPVLSLGAGYGTDTELRGTLGWVDSLVNTRGHRFRFELKGSAITRRVETRYDVPIGDPALERLSLEGINKFEDRGDLDTNELTLRPSVTRVVSRWQVVTSLSATRTTTEGGGQERFVSKLLVPGIVIASVPEDFLGQALFARGFYAELLGSSATLGSDASFLRLLVQLERAIDLNYRWHLLLRAEAGTSATGNFDDLPGIYRFFAGGDRSVRGFGYNSLSPVEQVTRADGSTGLDRVGGRHMLVGSAELVRDLPRNLAGAVFVDAGNAFNSFGDGLEYAAGVGLRYRLPGVSIGLDLAKPLSTGGDVRLHLNITPKL